MNIRINKTIFNIISSGEPTVRILRVLADISEDYDVWRHSQDGDDVLAKPDELLHDGDEFYTAPREING